MLFLCSVTHILPDTKVAFIKSKLAATYSSLILKISLELQTHSHTDWIHTPYCLHLTLWSPTT